MQVMPKKIENDLAKSFDIDRYIYGLLKDEPFFALLSRQLNKTKRFDIPTAGMSFNKERGQFEVIYNPTFMFGLEPKHKKWVLMHELYHASLGHCEFRNHEKLGVDRKTANEGMDLAINSLDNMWSDAPDFVLMPGRFPFASITIKGQATEWYVNQIPKHKSDASEPPEGEAAGGQFDDHSEMECDDPTSGERQIAEQKLADAVAKAAHECDFGDGKGGQPQGWGTVPHQMREQIKEFVGKRFKLDPKKVLATFIKASVAADKKTSVTKRNRRLPGKKFGRRTQHRANIAISIDQSGSVSDELLAKVFDWLGEFAKFASFTVVPFDASVFEEKVYVWKKGEKRKKERVLYGGTNFDAPTKFVNKRNFDGHIVITDMMAPKPIRSKCQRMWLTDTYGARCSYFQPIGERLLVLK